MTADLTKEVTIDAAPATIFPYLVDPSMFVKWMGTEASLSAVPGGEFRALCGGQYPAAGEFLEVVENERVVFTFGWDVPDHAIPAGSSEVEITLTPKGDSTVVRLVHRGLPESAINDHLGGWTYYLGRLEMVVAGKDPGPDLPQGE